MIFFHSSFRTSSTFIWSKFRAKPLATTYCEIFHEILNSLKREEINGINSASWHSKHPAGAPYFLEFLPLIDERHRVAGFDPSFSYDRFIPIQGPNGPISELEANYVQGLVAHAEARGQIPVLTATRSIGRLPGLKASAPGLHVLLYRNLFQQWCSYTEQADRVGRYFLDRTIDVVRVSQHDPVIREIAAMFPVEVASERDRNTFCQFLFLHLYCYAHAAPAADFVLDINRVISDPAHRHEVEAVFAGQGLPVDLSDARPSIGFSLLDFPSSAEMRDLISVMGRVVIARAPSDAGRRFAQRAIDDLLDEHDRHAFHATGIRSVLGRAIAEGETARAEADQAHAQHEALLAERDAAQAALDDATRAHAAAEAEHAAALSQLQAMQFEYEAARTELTTIRNERNAALTDHDNSVLARQSAEAERDAALAERERVETERQAEAQGRQAAETERDALKLEAEAERRAREAAEAELRAATAMREAVESECERVETERQAEAQGRQAAETERDSLKREAEAERRAREAAEAELRAATAMREAFESERERAEAEREAEAQTRQAAEVERDASRTEAQAERQAREAAEQERRAAETARDTAEAERETERVLRLRVEEENLAEAMARQRAESERDAAFAERDRERFEIHRVRSENLVLAAERDAASEARRALEAEHDTALLERDRSRVESEQLRIVGSAAAGERDAALAALAAAEARHAELVRWSVAFHESTAASLSWKLTRPLRWLGIGRPKRPGNPPV